MTNVKRKKIKVKNIVRKVVSIDDITCPICGGGINQKWLSFRSKHCVEFVAECYKRNKQDDEYLPSHIFYFQIEVPECILVYNTGSKVFDDSGGR